MKKYISLLLVPIAFVLLSANRIPTPMVNTYAVDLKNSKILWNIKTSRGSNNGVLLLRNGVIKEEYNQVKSSMIEMDMTAIQINSIPPGIVNMKAVTILNTESFFDVARYPSSSLEITRCSPKSSSSFEATGYLTIKGRRNPIRFLMQGGFSNGHFSGVSKNIIVNRDLYNIKYTSAEGTADKELDLKVEDAIDQSFTIDVYIVANIER